MTSAGQPQHRDMNRHVFRLIIVATLVANYVVLSGKEPFGA